MAIKYKDKEIVTINRIDYQYDEFYKRLVVIDQSLRTPHVLCPVCIGHKFVLKYGQYEIVAHCCCGHTMTVYDG